MGPDNNLFLHIIHVHDSHEGKSAGNVVQAYLFGILATKGRSVSILSDNGTEFKNHSPQ